jgi:sulfate-transporting ATPase
MQDAARFALLGLGIGALYALASQGLIVIYRGSGVLNFGLGAMGMAGAYLEYELSIKSGWPFVPALIVGVLFSAFLGAIVYLGIMRPLRNSSPLVRVIATLGVLITLQSIAILHYGSSPLVIASQLPTTILRIHQSIVITEDRLILLGIALALTVGLFALYRYTKFGLGTSAVAENQRAAASLGWSPDVVATGNWVLGSALAGLAAILIAPIVTLDVGVMTNLMLAATAAALVAGFRSFPIAMGVGLLLGIAQSEATRWVTQPGFAAAVPFILIIVWMVIRGQALPLRDYLLQRLPTIGTGRIRWGGVLLGVVVAVVLMGFTSTVWISAFTVTVASGVILLSIVVLTGYAGQLSLAQFAIAGFGAYVAGRLESSQGLPFWAALLVGVAATVPLGMVFALPAVRTRGINLAIVTLGLGGALELMLFDNPAYTGGVAGTIVPPANLFGWDMNPITRPTRYGLFAVACLLLVIFAVANMRRGRSGRRLIAVRTNERAAAALGINVPGAKLYAFGLAGAIAALGGILLAYTTVSISYTNFTNFTSITDVALAVIGGLGYLIGPVIGGTLAQGGMWTQIFNSLGGGVAKYVPLISGVSVIALVLQNQNGIAKQSISQIRWVAARLSRLIPALRPKPRPPVALPQAGVTRAASHTLEVEGLTVRYGGTVGVDSVSLTVRPGAITGLIGPNGAGKTSLIDAVTGFTAMSGKLKLDGREISGWSPARRARAGLGRSFQSLELFDDSTVIDNLRVASDPRDALSYARDIFWPINPPLASEVVSAITEFGLNDELEKLPGDLSYGKRRLLAIARAVATHPSVLLLDEPAAGLGDVESRELATLVRRLADDWGMGILLVEHDMNFVMTVCDDLVVIDFGRKIAEGKPEVVRQDPTVIAAYLGEEEAHVEHGAPATAGPPRMEPAR